MKPFKPSDSDDYNQEVTSSWKVLHLQKAKSAHPSYSAAKSILELIIVVTGQTPEMNFATTYCIILRVTS